MVADNDIANLALAEEKYARMAVDLVRATLEFGPNPVYRQRKRLHHVALRVPTTHTLLWELRILPKLVNLRSTTVKNHLAVEDRLLVWCETRVCDNFTQEMIALRRDFLAGTDLWSEGISLGQLLAAHHES